MATAKEQAWRAQNRCPVESGLCGWALPYFGHTEGWYVRAEGAKCWAHVN